MIIKTRPPFFVGTIPPELSSSSQEFLTSGVFKLSFITYYGERVKKGTKSLEEIPAFCNCAVNKYSGEFTVTFCMISKVDQEDLQFYDQFFNQHS